MTLKIQYGQKDPEERIERQPSSESLLPERLPELDISVLVGVMKQAFQVLVWEPSADKPRRVRLVGSPYRPSEPNCRHLDVPFDEHTRKVSPLVIRQVLNKFQIAPVEFVEAARNYKVEPIEIHTRKRPSGATG